MFFKGADHRCKEGEQLGSLMWDMYFFKKHLDGHL